MVRRAIAAAMLSSNESDAQPNSALRWSQFYGLRGAGVLCASTGGFLRTTKPDWRRCSTSRRAVISRHDIVGLMNPFPPLKAQGECDSLGQIVQGSRRQCAVVIGHRSAPFPSSKSRDLYI